MDEKVTLTDEEWRQRLTPEQYAVLRKASTERPFTGQYVHVRRQGRVHVRRLRRRAVQLRHEVRLRHRLAELLRTGERRRRRGASRLEHGHPAHGDSLRKCGGHLGHVFPDGPEPTGQRYCMNSCALKLEKSAG